MIGDDQPINPATEKLPDAQEAFASLKGLSFEDALSKIANGLVDFAFKLAIAIFVFYVGRMVIRKIYTMTLRVMTGRKMDASLTTFVLSLVKILLYFILIITVIGILGIETSSFLALFASAGVAIGMALSGTLQNFAGGVLILLLKPYKVGDYIEAQGYSGTVKSIQLFSTVINTVDNKAIIIPNGGLSTSSINNFSLEQYRRVDWTVSLAYGTDFEAARQCILEMLYNDPRVVKQYIEDDALFREKEEHEKDCIENPELCEDEEAKLKKMNFFSRWRYKTRLKRERVKKKLSDEQIEMNASIPIKVERKPFVALSELADSSINITVRAWTHSSTYWPLYFDINERFYKELPQKGFSFPFPQMDIHINKEN